MTITFESSQPTTISTRQLSTTNAQHFKYSCENCTHTDSKVRQTIAFYDMSCRIVYLSIMTMGINKKKLKYKCCSIRIKNIWKSYLSNSVNLEESRNPFANGLLSIFSFVICKNRNGNLNKTKMLNKHIWWSHKLEISRREWMVSDLKT